VSAASRHSKKSRPLSLRILEQADRDRKLSFWRGFNQGVLAGILTSQGQLALSKNISPPEESYPETPFKIVTGPQLKLFE
jgi:hypothetical protein